MKIVPDHAAGHDRETATSHYFDEEPSTPSRPHVVTLELPDMKLEIVVLGVSDVDRAKAFYGKLGWRLDADFANGDAFRVVQLTPASRNAMIFSPDSLRLREIARPSF